LIDSGPVKSSRFGFLADVEGSSVCLVLSERCELTQLLSVGSISVVDSFSPSCFVGAGVVARAVVLGVEASDVVVSFDLVWPFLPL